MCIERNAETRKSETVSRVSESHLNASGIVVVHNASKIYNVVKASRVPTRLLTAAANATETMSSYREYFPALIS